MQELLTPLVFLAAGAAGGILLGLIGVGMALITVPLLALTLPWFGVGPALSPLVALASSMAIVTLGALSSVASHHRLGNVDWQTVRRMVPFSVAGVVAGSLLASHMPALALRWVLCLFQLVIAWRMLQPRGTGTGTGTAAPAPLRPASLRLAGAAIGFAGSLIGAGGGIFLVPFLNHRGFPMPRAVATSTAVGLPVTASGAVFYALQPAPLPDLWMLGDIFLPAFLGIGLGSALFAPLGARLSSRVPGALLKRGFALLLIVLALRIALG